MMTTPPLSSAAAPPAPVDTLPHELHEFVLELAVAVHKRGIYPPGHPILNGAVDALTRRLQALLASRGHLAMGVARMQLIVDGISTDEEHPILRELALQLHEHQLGALRFVPGIERIEVDELLAAISVSATRGAVPLGTRDREELSQWPHVTLFPMIFDRLELLDEGDAADPQDQAARDGATRAGTLWIGLARAALAGGWSDGAAIDPHHIARSIDEQIGSDGYDQVIVGYLLQIVDEMKRDGSRANPQLVQRVSALVQNMSERSIAQLLHMGGQRVQRQDFVRDATAHLSAGAVVDLARAAAEHDGKPIAHSVLRLLGKLARDASSRRPTSRAADRALRHVIRRMLANWTLDDPNPETYSLVLSDIVAARAQAGRDEQRDACEPERILEVALEAEALGPSVEAALGRLAIRDGVAQTLERLRVLPDSAARESLIDRLFNEATFREQLATARPDLALMHHAVDRMRARAVRPLLQAMEQRAESDAGWIVELLARVGWDALEPLGRDLAALPPRVLRHVLLVFDRLDAWPPASDPSLFARHPDPAVRRESVRYLLKHDETREEGMLIGLRDPDARVFNLAINAAMRGCSPEAARVLMLRFDEPGLNDELRARSIRVIAGVQGAEVLRWLTARGTTTHWLTGSVRLRKPSLEVLAVISAIAHHYAREPDAATVLGLARLSRDEQVRRAASARGQSLGAL